MSFSFIDIEESKNRIIFVVFIFIVLFYFLTTYLILVILENSLVPSSVLSRRGFFFPPASHALIVLIAAFFIALLHWVISTNRLIEKMAQAAGARPIDENDIYHQYFKNIVDEVSVAIGGRKIEAMVIPSAGTNAFALQDFNRRSVIGVTEGLLARLNRPQIEAVVAHEAAHIVCGDSLLATVITSLSELYEEALFKMKAALRGSRGRGSALFFLLYIVLLGMNTLSKMLHFFLSRQREYRADAVGTRLTRNPLSLAEALRLISEHWRGSGAEGARLESIFIVNPRHSWLDEREGLLSIMFSTHPPIKKRINLLLNMAHMDDKTLEANLKNFKRVSPVALAQFKVSEDEEPKKWFVFQESKWQGPFLFDEIMQLEGLRPDHWVRPEGLSRVIPAYEDKELKNIFLKSDGEITEPVCPHCKTGLSEFSYEGVHIFKCSFCSGIFLDHDKISRILIRKDMEFCKEVKKLGETIIKGKKKFILKNKAAKSAWVMDCPRCKQKMHRQFFVYSYPVEIERCLFCSGVWFDKQELEILQYLFENQEQLFAKL
ncbi:MAG: hypothetical protein DRZ76_00255 [Candidatus Nealsonbacteria bacterium]|nr:MAG: hypothetical protein DRZ76_00255 [Candidatus Nealsonbacteria bacterium]